MASVKQHSTDMQRNGFVKDSFGFKMSKKVAELTQVVHMLFSRNHEREVELDALKATYEEEVHRIIKQAKVSTEKLEFLLRDATRQRQKDVVQAADSTNLLLKETQEKMEQMRQDLTEERSQLSKYRELLAQTQKELEKAKQASIGMSASLEQANALFSEKENELSRVRSLQKKMQDQYKINERELEEMKRKYRESEERIIDSQSAVSRLNKALEESNRQSDELAKKLQVAEEEAKAAKRELKKRSQLKNNHYQRSAATTSSGSRRFENKNEEIESLRREIERLRMELSNREGNFNRVFAKFQPVVVSSEAQRPQSNRMMMVTPTFSEGDTGNRKNFSLSSSRPPAESSPQPRSPGALPFSNLTSTDGSALTKPLKNLSQKLEPPRLNGNSRNGTSQFRLVYTK